jgi:hypothetical protein
MRFHAKHVSAAEFRRFKGPTGTELSAASGLSRPATECLVAAAQKPSPSMGASAHAGRVTPTNSIGRDVGIP